MAAAALSSSSSSLQRCSLARCAPRRPSRPKSPSPTSPCRLPAPHPPHMALTCTCARPPRPAAAPRRPAAPRPPARRWRSAPTRPSSRPRWACGSVQGAVSPLVRCSSDNAPSCTSSDAARPRSRPPSPAPIASVALIPPPATPTPLPAGRDAAACAALGAALQVRLCGQRGAAQQPGGHGERLLTAVLPALCCC